MKTALSLLAALLLAAAASAQVSYERLRHAEAEPANWLTYSGSYAGQRYSPLAEITPAKVVSLFDHRITLPPLPLLTAEASIVVAASTFTVLAVAIG